MRVHERIVAGMSCGDVLKLLSDYIDGDLDAAARAHVDEHLRGCDWCERFGGRFADVVQTMRRSLTEADALPDDVAERLRTRLRKL